MSQHEKTNDFQTGAVRSADANHLDFTSLPLIGLIGVARTASEGGTKYGRYNYMQGMPVHDTLNHSIRHVFMYILGDRSEPHLEHAAWGLLASIQQQVLDADVSAPHLLGPGARITEDVQEYLDFNSPGLAARRKAGEFDGIGDWKLTDLPEIKKILKQRAEAIESEWDEIEKEESETTATCECQSCRDDAERMWRRRDDLLDEVEKNGLPPQPTDETIELGDSELLWVITKGAAGAAERVNRNPEILGERVTVTGFDEAENLKFYRPNRRFKKTAKKSRKPTRPSNSDAWAEVLNRTIGKYVAEKQERLGRISKMSEGHFERMVALRAENNARMESERVNRNPEILESLSKIRDTSGMDFEARRKRFRVEHPVSKESRICVGFIWRNNKIEENQSHDWDLVLFVTASDSISLLLREGFYAHKRVLVVHKDDWDAGEPYEIDSAWGYATASSKSSKITGEVTRTEKIHQHSFDAHPLADEDFVDFLTESVRVYFKKS